ncbi:MAG: hypothetical protein ACJ795_01140 [Ktedonobacteraceae bacterium]
MQAAGTPLVESRILTGYAWEAQQTRQVAYLNADGHVHELQAEVNGSWKHQDLTHLFEAPLAQEAALSGYVWQIGETKQVVSIGEDGDIYELAAGADKQWSLTDLTAATSAPLAAGSTLAGFAWETGRSKQVVYVGGDHHVHELTLKPKSVWKTPSSSNPAKFPVQPARPLWLRLP